MTIDKDTNRQSNNLIRLIIRSHLRSHQKDTLKYQKNRKNFHTKLTPVVLVYQNQSHPQASQS